MYRLAEITNLNDDKLIKVDKLINLNENIDFRDVSFSYNNNILVLNSISSNSKNYVSELLRKSYKKSQSDRITPSKNLIDEKCIIM